MIQDVPIVVTISYVPVCLLYCYDALTLKFSSRENVDTFVLQDYLCHLVLLTAEVFLVGKILEL